MFLDVDTCILIPAHNEEETINEVVENVVKFIANSRLSAEIILINDGSSDATGQICEKWRNLSIIKVYHHRFRMGYGAAIKTGFQYAHGKVIIIMDADGQSDACDIPLLLRKLSLGYDCIVGWRKNREDSFHRRIISKVFNVLVNTVFKLGLHDVNGKPKAVRRGVINKLSIKAANWLIDLELLVKMKREGYKIAEIPVTHRPRKRGRSKLSIKSIIETAYGIVSLRLGI